MAYYQNIARRRAADVASARKYESSEKQRKATKELRKLMGPTEAEADAAYAKRYREAYGRGGLRRPAKTFAGHEGKALITRPGDENNGTATPATPPNPAATVTPASKAVMAQGRVNNARAQAIGSMPNRRSIVTAGRNNRPRYAEERTTFDGKVYRNKPGTEKDKAGLRSFLKLGI